MSSNDVTVTEYLSNVCGSGWTSRYPERSYTPIKILYDRDGYVSPLQRWNHMLIDLDSINCIKDAIAWPRYEYSRLESCHIKFDIIFKVNAEYSFMLACRAHHGNSSDIKTQIIEGSVEYYDIGNDRELVQKYIVDDLINVFRLYKEKYKV
jgi:hypothetical protein